MTNKDTIGSFASSLQAAFSALRAARDLPSELEPLRSLVPDGFTPRVTIGRLDANKKFKSRRVDADFDKYWEPSECHVLISFAPDLPGSSLLPSPPAQPSLPSRLQDLLNALEHAEALPGLQFVGLKWFRDQHLPQQGFSWTADPRERSAQLREATGQGIVLTIQVPNPKAPSHPTTTIRLNRSHPRFLEKAAPAAGGKGPFRPRKIEGGPMSQTIIEGRR